MACALVVCQVKPEPKGSQGLSGLKQKSGAVCPLVFLLHDDTREVYISQLSGAETQ